MMPYFENIIFDLDGTLSDSRSGIINSYVEALKTLGHTPDASFDFSHVIGPPVREVMEGLLGHFGDTRISEGIAAHWAHYENVGIVQNALYHGIKAMIDALSSQGRRLYIATAKRQSLAAHVLKNLDILDRFAGVYGSGDDGSLEHKSDLIAHLLHVESLESETTVMIGDRSHDIVGAHANKICGIGVTWGYGSADELRCANPDHIVSSPAALYRILGTGSSSRTLAGKIIAAATRDEFSQAL
ncbi:phosphoglycolate phosphatase [Agrobacterium larrymoorei]|uniref:Phosphoglycolate phosphatase n=1 Tax=Agrobacterium larrymoorei TaxID=160699 RepID=A0AAJ2ER26_9HYPH|nr:HAD hydrolase-like protein [Agrobacterium larrymoorei]MDR6101740.1 phosphoglycolate phosphatase [Agrobacterium larrymoorei]